MSQRVVVLGSTVAAAVFALIAVTVAMQMWKEGTGDLQVEASRQRELESRLDRLEDVVDRRFRELRRDLLKGRGAVTVPEKSSAASEDGGAVGSGALARIEARLDDIELRLQAEEDDPLLRGYAYMTSKSWRMRAAGIRMLQKMARTDPEAALAIRNMLDDPESEVREEALKALEEAKDRASIPKMAVLLEDGAPGVREEAVESLSDLLREKGTPEQIEGVTDTLLDRLGDEDRDVREAAAEALGDLGLKQAVPALIRSLEDSEEQVRSEALAALVALKDPRALPALRALYAEGASDDAMALAQALMELGDEEPLRRETDRLAQVATSGSSARARWDAIKELSEHDAARYRGVFEAALRDSSPVVRKAAQMALKKVQGK